MVYEQSTQCKDNQRRKLVRPRHLQLQDQRDGKKHDDAVNQEVGNGQRQVDLGQVSGTLELVLLAGIVIVEMDPAAEQPAEEEAASPDDDQRSAP